MSNKHIGEILPANDGAFIQSGGQTVVKNGGQAIINFYPTMDNTQMEVIRGPQIILDPHQNQSKQTCGLDRQAGLHRR